MFTRIRETRRILTYREPQNAPGIVFVEYAQPRVSPAGKHIARLLEVGIVIVIIGWISVPMSTLLQHLIPKHLSGSLPTIAGAVGALLMFVLNWLREDIERNIKEHFTFGETFAQFFGHKLDDTFRTLKS
ncbi:MAG: hypothetical protein ABSB50_03180 [Terracidiphilus sp.]|jgi:ribosome biogenesis protein Tsr3